MLHSLPSKWKWMEPSLSLKRLYSSCGLLFNFWKNQLILALEYIFIITLTVCSIDYISWGFNNEIGILHLSQFFHNMLWQNFADVNALFACHNWNFFFFLLFFPTKFYLQWMWGPTPRMAWPLRRCASSLRGQ